MSDQKLKFSICIPVYKGSKLIGLALDSIKKQAFDTYQIIIGDDNQPQDEEESLATKKIVEDYGFKELKYIRNPQNLGYPRNLQNIVKHADGDVLFLMAQDDILSRNALQRTHDAFFLAPNVGAVTRPYFWFKNDVKKPVRAVTPYDPNNDAVIDITNNKAGFMKIFESVGQLSGLAYMRKFIDIPFNDEVFPAHIYPFASIIKKHKCVFLKDYTVAVGIEDSQTRHVSSIYDNSPTLSWLKMYDTVFAEENYKKQREWGYEHILTNYLGLVQLKNYAKKGVFENEIKIMLEKYPTNRVNAGFIAFCLLLEFFPRQVSRKLTDWVKYNYTVRNLPDLSFEL